MHHLRRIIISSTSLAKHGRNLSLVAAKAQQPPPSHHHGNIDTNQHDLRKSATSFLPRSSFLRSVYNKDRLNKVIQTASNLLSINQEEAEIFLATIYLDSLSLSSKKSFKKFADDFEEKLILLTGHLTSSQIVNNPHLLMIPLPSLSAIIADLKAIGVATINPTHLVNPTLIWRLNEREWKDCKLLGDAVDCAASYISSLTDATESMKQSIYEKLSQEIPNYKLVPLQELKTKIKEMNINEIKSMTESETVNQLVQSRLLDPKILQYIRYYDDICSLDYGPRVALTQPHWTKEDETLITTKIMTIASEFNFDQDQLLLGSRTFSMSVERIRSRLNILTSIFGQDVLKSKFILSCIFGAEKGFNKRLEKLKRSHQGKDVLFQVSSPFHRIDLITVHVLYLLLLSKAHYLKAEFQPEHFKKMRRLIQIDIVRNPNFRYFSMAHAFFILDYLVTQEKIEPVQFVNCPAIILYSRSSIQQAFKLIRDSPNYSKWINKPYILHLVLYKIHRENLV